MEVLNFYHLGKKIPENAIYIGREMPHLGLERSKYCNPYKLNDGETRGATIERYRRYLWAEIKKGNITLEELRALSDKDLVCFCKQKNKDVPCHGDVLKSAVEWAIKETS